VATHDYVISNGTGSAVRSDLNGALAAIVSQNSNASAPATTYAYMSWADTSAGVMKMRNGANSAWISLYELDGTFLASDISLAAGSAAAPSLFFTGDTNTGLFSPGADTVALATAGQNRLHVSSGGLVGIGTTIPSETLHVAGTIRVGTTSDYVYANNFGQISSALPLALVSNSETVFKNTSNQERARIDSSGRLLVGTSSARTNFENTTTSAALQIEGTGIDTSNISVTRNANNDNAPQLTFAKSRGASIGSNTLVSNADYLGGIIFSGSDGSEFVNAAFIGAQVDGTPGANDMPGRLVFSTTADGAASPTERMRINNVGSIKQQGSGASLENAAGDYNELNINAAGTTALLQRATNSSFTGVVSVLKTTKAANTNFQFISAEANGAAQFAVRGDGNVSNTNNSYGAISDLKLKENIVDATSQWSDIKALQVRKYNLKEGQTHTQIGLIAQEVELVSPGLVGESPDRDEEGNDLGTVTKSVNYSVLYMKAVKALQEAMERIETLEASNANILARLSALEAA